MVRQFPLSSLYKYSLSIHQTLKILSTYSKYILHAQHFWYSLTKMDQKLCSVVCLLVVLGLGFCHGAPQVPCYFILGDSLVDNGNNNRLTSLAKANYLPYGIDFPNGPTGRFSNGKTTVDVVGSSASAFSIFLCRFYFFRSAFKFFCPSMIILKFRSGSFSYDFF